jgi:hypothetical protein
MNFLNAKYREYNCISKINKFIDSDTKNRKSSKEIGYFLASEVNNERYCLKTDNQYLNNMRERLEEMQSEREKDEHDKLSEEDKEKKYNKQQNALTKNSYFFANTDAGGKKKMKTRRNKIKGRKSRKSKFSKNTRKRINKKKA